MSELEALLRDLCKKRCIVSFASIAPGNKFPDGRPVRSKNRRYQVSIAQLNDDQSAIENIASFAVQNTDFAGTLAKLKRHLEQGDLPWEDIPPHWKLSLKKDGETS